MSLNVSSDIRDAVVDAVTAAIGATGKVKFRTLAPPTNILDAEAGVEVVVISLTTWPASSAGSSATADTPRTANATSSNDIGHFYVTTSADAKKLMGDVTATGGGGAITFDNVSAVSGSPVNLNSLTISCPESQS